MGGRDTPVLQCSQGANEGSKYTISNTENSISAQEKDIITMIVVKQ